MNLIALGDTATKIAEAFLQYPQYKVRTISSSQNTKTPHYKLSSFSTPEEYEERCPMQEIGFFLGNVEAETIFVTCGADYESACSLRILEQVTKGSSVKVLYIEPEVETLQDTAILLERSVRSVLQEYARSGVFSEIVLVSVPQARLVLGDVSILEYEQKLNELVASTIHMINVFRHSDPIYNSQLKHKDVSRISTIGMASLKNNEESLLYPLDNVKEKRYIYSISKDSLENDNKLMSKITEQVKNSAEKDKIKAGFEVYSSEYDDNYVYVVARTSFIQEQWEKA
tara:strand:+ start:3457 stop:4311 length:855 start_codon:yes stop_codon:yes gene_type:complete